MGPTTKEGLYALRVAGKMLRCYTLSPNRSERRLPAPNLLRHVSPLGWEHIVLTGDYDWNSGAAVRTNARPLNLYPARIRA